MEIKTYKQILAGYDNKSQRYTWERIHLVIDNKEVCIWEPATLRFWIGLYEDKNFKGKRYTNQKKYRVEVEKFLKECFQESKLVYLDWLKLEEQNQFAGNFWEDRINNLF